MLSTLLSSSETCIDWYGVRFNFRETIKDGGLYFCNFQIKMKIRQGTTTPKGQYFGIIFSSIT
jgi:hypothetical protein